MTLAASDVNAAIALRCAQPEWATFFEVGDTTGFGQSRRADAIAVNTWPSRGGEVHGFEVKIARGDWLRELKDPGKSAPIQRFCSRWWIAVSDDGIVKREELPPTWGLLKMRGTHLVEIVPAPELKPERPTIGFVSALLRAGSQRFIDRSIVHEEVTRRVNEHRLRLEAEHAHELEGYRRRTEDVEKHWRELVDVTGPDIAATLRGQFYRGLRDREDMRQALLFVSQGGLAGSAKRLDELAYQMKTLQEQIAATLAVARGTSSKGASSIRCDVCGNAGETAGERCGAVVAFVPCTGTLREEPDHS